MVTRIRRGAKAHVYLREWRKAKGVHATAMADRLEIERESYYRLEREPQTLSVAEVMELADALGIDAPLLWQPPPESGQPTRVSLDAIVADLPTAQVEGLADMLRRSVGKS
jgi:transcriptional regulator with XRE-family HTH domain